MGKVEGMQDITVEMSRRFGIPNRRRERSSEECELREEQGEPDTRRWETNTGRRQTSRERRHTGARRDTSMRRLAVSNTRANGRHDGRTGRSVYLPPGTLTKSGDASANEDMNDERDKREGDRTGDGDTRREEEEAYTLIIFDWDDTFLPTSVLRELQKNPLRCTSYVAIDGPQLDEELEYDDIHLCTPLS